MPKSQATLADPAKSNFIFICGKKGSGKSSLAWCYFLSYPFARVVIDITGDIGMREGWIDITDEIPLRWTFDKNATLYFRPDPGSPNYITEMDQVVGLAFQHGKTIVWVDEFEDLAPVHKTPPWTKRAERQGRHKDLSVIFCSIRPKGIDPLALSQADIVAIFELPGDDDRDRIATECHIKRAELDAALDQLHEHEFLLYLAHNPPGERLFICPALPKSMALPKAA